MLQDFAGDRDSYFLDDPQDIAFRGIRIRSQKEVGGGEGVEMSDMAVDVSG